MINELIPVIGYHQAMLISGYSNYQIQQIIKGSSYESVSQKQ
jgi:hypothetical protein